MGARMHFDLAHAIVSAVLILGTIFALNRMGLGKEKGQWNWYIFGAVFAVMLVLNLLWPSGP